MRYHDISVMTSFPAGKSVPVAAIPMLREDALRARVSIAVEMLETKELLMNPVRLRASAYLVPLLALERFNGSRDQFDRSWAGLPPMDGEAVVPFIEKHAMGAHGSNAVYKALGLHGKPTDQVNTSYLEAYNLIWNFRAKNRSKELAPRARLATDLAPAFWHHSRFAHIVPDVDLAMMDGEIALNLVNADLAVMGPGGATSLTVTRSGVNAQNVVRKASDGTVFAPGAKGDLAVTTTGDLQFTSNGTNLFLDPNGTLKVDLAGVIAEMTAGGVTVSLSNLELARKTQAWAKIRQRYDGLSEEYLIDMLLSGLSIPDQAFKQPMLLADRVVTFRQAKRYATDAGNLSESAVSGGAMVQLTVRVPQINTGGIVMVLLEAVPDQLFERQRDPWFHLGSVDDLPNYLRDDLDPEKVSTVLNGEIDTDHATPDGVFGYGPLNWQWSAFGHRIGGKFYRPSTNTLTDDARQRLWAVENVNPTLSADFYIVNGLHQKPFLDTVSEPFEATVAGRAEISGLTIFGPRLVEGSDNYDEVLEKAPVERINQGD